jgi:hypothetical protein
LSSSYDTIGVEISLAESEGCLELLFKLYVLLKHPSISELDNLLIRFQQMDASELVKELISIMGDVVHENQLLWLNVDAGSLTESGSFQPWLSISLLN